MRCFCCDVLSTKNRPVKKHIDKNGVEEFLCQGCREAIWPQLKPENLGDLLFLDDDREEITLEDEGYSDTIQTNKDTYKL